MQCPVCECRSLLRDYANPRAYGFLFFGLLLVLMAKVLLPLLLPLYTSPYLSAAQVAGQISPGATVAPPVDVFEPLYTAIQRVLTIGLLCLGIGAFDLIRDGSRYCPSCGFRGRFFYKQRDTQTDKALSNLHSHLHHDKKDEEAHIAPDQPVAPLLKMLRFKSPAMRKQAVSTLNRLTGEDFGENADAWDAWYAEHGPDFERKRREK